MATLKVKESPRTHAALRAHDVIIDKNDNVGPYLMTIDEFLDDFGVNAVNYRVVEFVSGGVQNASSSYDVYVFRSAGALQLPSATTLNGQPIIVVNLTTSDNVTVTAYSGQSINNVNSIVITNQDSEQLIPSTTGFLLTAKNKIKSRSESLSWFNANHTIILDKGEQVFLLGSPQYKVGDTVTPLNLLPWSTKQLTDYIASNDIALANKQDKLSGTGVVYSTAGVITYVTLNNGNMTSLGVTDGYVPVYNAGLNKYINGPVYIDTVNPQMVVLASPSAGAFFSADNNIAKIGADQDVIIGSDHGNILLNSPNITNDRVVCIDASGNVKTFTITPALLDNLSGSTSPLQAQIVTLDGSVVHLTGNETIANVKTFSSSPIVPNPTTPLQVANKAYVDQLAAGVQLKVDVHAVSTANITLSGTQTIDTVALVVGNRALVKDQSTQTQNGIYIVAAGAWTRSTDMDASIEFNNATVQCRAGSANLNTEWRCTVLNPLLGTDPVLFQLTSLSSSFNAGDGLDLVSNTFSIETGGVTAVMLATNAVDLATNKVTGVLAQTKGGKGNATVYAAGSIPVQNASSQLVEYAELKFDPALKTLVLNNTTVTPNSGLAAISVQSNSQDSPGVLFNGAGSAMVAVYSGGDYALILSGTNTAGKGIQVSSIDVAGDFSGEKEVFRVSQTGEAAADNISPALSIYRDINLVNAGGTFTATGPMLNIYDDTTSTGHRILIKQQDNNQMILTKDGYLGLGNNTTIDEMIVMEGTADRTVKVGYHPTSGNAGKKLILMGGSAAVGSTNIQGGNVEVVTGSSRGNLGANFVIKTTAPGSSGTGENSATQQYIFKGDGRVGFGVNLPAARFELWTPNGSNALDIINKDQSTVNNTGWGWTPLTNGAGTNLVLYEKVGGVQTNRIIHHINGNITIGNDSGSGDAKLNVKGTLKIEGGSPAVNKWLKGDAVGLTSWDYLPVQALPNSTYAAASAPITDTAIITNVIPASTFSNDGDKVIYDFVFVNNGGTAGNMIYKILLDGNELNNSPTVPVNTSSCPLSARVTLRRVGSNRIYYTLNYDYGTHSNTLQDMYATNDTTTAYTFTSAMNLVLTANPGTTGRTTTGMFGNGQYFKAL
jgi:hypothetical protein